MEQVNEKISIIVIAYNEIDSLPETFSAVLALRDKIEGKTQVILVDDGSRDGSTEWIRQKEREFSFVKAIIHRENRGIGEALISGYLVAKGEWIVALSADGQFAPQDIALALPHLEMGDVICLYRKNKKDYGLFRKFVSQANCVLNAVFFGLNVRDVNWVKIYKKWVIKDIQTVSQSPFIESERLIRAKKRGARIIEIEAPSYCRRHGRAKGACFVTIFKSLRDFFKVLSVRRAQL